MEDGMALINLGNENRKIASTAMNARSSRSHTIFRVVLEATKTDEVLERERKLLESLPWKKKIAKLGRVFWKLIVFLLYCIYYFKSHKNRTLFSLPSFVHASLLPHSMLC